MLKLHIKYFILFLVIAGGAKAQEAEQETKYAFKIDSTTQNKWMPTGVRFGFDIAGPIYNLFEPSISNYEGMADIDFAKFFAVVELGKGSFQSGNTPTHYTSDGVFFRIGADVNMVAKDPKLNVMYFGLRYATSRFDETLKGELPNSGWGVTPIEEKQLNSKANWIEMNLGVRLRLWKSIFTGYTLRFKLLKHSNYNEDKFDTYFTPGYGVASNTVNWGINYYIFYKFAWKKKAIKWRDN